MINNASGNQTTRTIGSDVYTYAYDSANRLTSITGNTTATYTYNGLGDRLAQNGVQYTLDLNAGLTQVLDDGTNNYLYGLGRIAEQQGGANEFYLGDALGSARQVVDDGGSVALARVYSPYGETAYSAGTAQTDYGFTNEYTSQGLIYLRARHYVPEIGRFLTRDTWTGIYNRPLSLNRWNYGYSNPIKYTDSSGLQPTDVECDKIMLVELKNLCKIANMDDKDPQKGEEVLQARETFFRWIVSMSYSWSVMPEPWGGEGYYYAGKMLGYFLNSASYVRVDLGSNTRFDDDPGIMRATWKSMPATAADEPMTITPLLYIFLKDYIKPNIGCDTYQVLSPVSLSVANNPRPQTVGWWGAFGHVPFIEATYSNITIMRTYGDVGYVVKTQVKYHVLDKYEWFGGAKKTPLPLGYPNPGGKPPFNYVEIPHEWEDSLVAANRAFEYPFDIYWSDYFQIVLPNDFSQFLPYGKSGWIPLE